MESLRLHPIAPGITRTVATPFEFGGFELEEGAIILVAMSVPHFLDEVFPDPTRFDTGRFEEPRAEPPGHGRDARRLHPPRPVLAQRRYWPTLPSRRGLALVQLGGPAQDGGRPRDRSRGVDTLRETRPGLGADSASTSSNEP